MVEDGKEAIGSMGDDTPPAVLSTHYRPLSHYFRQNFSQVTNPPIDPLARDRVMSLKTRFKNLGNILAEDESPDRHPACWTARSSDHAACTSAMRGAGRRRRRREIDCTFPAGERARATLRAGARPHPRRGRGRGARGCRPPRALRPTARAPTRVGDADDPGDRRACIAGWRARACAPSSRSSCARPSASTRTTSRC